VKGHFWIICRVELFIDNVLDLVLGSMFEIVFRLPVILTEFISLISIPTN